MSTPRTDRQRGQSLVMLLAFLAVCVSLLLGLFTLSLAVREKIRLQMAADLAVLSALNVQAGTLNALALGNRTILAHDALCAQLNALVSETTFYRKLLDGFSNIARLVPHGGPFLAAALKRGGEAVETMSRKSASLLIPIAGRSSTLIEREQDLLMLSLPFRSLKAAEDSRKINAPRSEFLLPARAAMLGEVTGRLRSIRHLPKEQVGSLVEGTLDSHTRRRNWSARVGGFNFPVKKQGGTSVSEIDYYGFDRLKVKVLRKMRWRWKTIVSASSSASDFGHRGHGRILDLTEREKPWSVTLALGTDLPPSPFLSPGTERRFVAVSSGALLYRRESRLQERPNLLNPFWGAELIPVGSEPLARKVLPGALLKEVRH